MLPVWIYNPYFPTDVFFTQLKAVGILCAAVVLFLHISLSKPVLKCILAPFGCSEKASEVKPIYRAFIALQWLQVIYFLVSSFIGIIGVLHFMLPAWENFAKNGVYGQPDYPTYVERFLKPAFVADNLVNSKLQPILGFSPAEAFASHNDLMVLMVVYQFYNCCFQLYFDFNGVSAFDIPLYCHHVIVAWALYTGSGAWCEYYACVFCGLTEFSNIPSVWTFLSKSAVGREWLMVYFPKSWSFFITWNDFSFVALFILFRVFCFLPVSVFMYHVDNYFMFREITSGKEGAEKNIMNVYKKFHGGEEKNPFGTGEDADYNLSMFFRWNLGVFFVSNFLLCLLNVFWTTLIVKKGRKQWNEYLVLGNKAALMSGAEKRKAMSEAREKKKA